MDTNAVATARVTAPAGPRAGNGRRIAAYLVDSVLAGIPFGLLAYNLPAVLGGVLGSMAWIGYFAALESRPSGQTVGKRLFGIRVIVFTDGLPLDLPRAVLRAVVRFVSSLGFGVGLLVGLFDGEKQAWHDVAARTVVVPTSAYPVVRAG